MMDDINNTDLIQSQLSELSTGLSQSSSKVIRLSILAIFCLLLLVLISMSYTCTSQYDKECECVYSLEPQLEVVRYEYNNLSNKKLEALNKKKSIEKSITELRAITSTLQVTIHDYSSNIMIKTQRIETLQAQIKHREELMSNYNILVKYKAEIYVLTEAILSFKEKINELNKPH